MKFQNYLPTINSTFYLQDIDINCCEEQQALILLRSMSLQALIKKKVEVYKDQKESEKVEEKIGHAIITTDTHTG